MKLVTYGAENGQFPGVVKDGCVIDVAALSAKSAPTSMRELLDAGPDALGRLAAAVAAVDVASAATFDGRPVVQPLSAVQLLAPLSDPRKLFCLAGNYEEHIREGGKDVRDKDRMTPRVFIKPASNTVIGPDAPILISRFAQFIDWEAELAVVIGQRGKYIPAAQALDYVAGYTILNDVSERRLQIRERNESEEWDKFFDWLNGKWLDTHAPMGPWIVTADEIPDPQQLGVTLSVNGTVKQQGNTGQMIFSVAELISYISQMVTLEPGDIISTGTPAGVGHARGERLQPGDEIRITIEGIGELVNPVVAES